MENSSNVHTRSQAQNRKFFFNSTKSDKDITLSQQFEAAEQHGKFSAVKSIEKNEELENQKPRRNLSNPNVKRRLFY